MKSILTVREYDVWRDDEFEKTLRGIYECRDTVHSLQLIEMKIQSVESHRHIMIYTIVQVKKHLEVRRFLKW